MTWPIITVSIKFESDVVTVRQRARRIAELLGFDKQDQTRIATAVSEIARNAHGYGRGGRAEFAIEDSPRGSQSLSIRISDQGPGIQNLDEILEGRHVSLNGMGLGIAGARRLMDEFAIASTAEKGTAVTLLKRLPRRRERVAQKHILELTKQLANETLLFDPVQEVREQNRELMASLAAERLRQDELAQLNAELEDTNRGVVALYAELDTQAEELRRASELKSRFLSNMSHEFRTPLNSIMALARLLLDRVDGDLTEEQTRQVEYVRKSAESLVELVNDLLDIAKVEAGKIEIRAVEFSISELFGGLRGALRPLRVSDAVDLVFEEPGDIPRMFADESKIAQILRNFVSNALKFTERGEVRVSAKLGKGNQVVFCVKDTGVGIAPQHHLTVFQEFSQVENPLQSRAKGTGLGLPLSKKLAELLGGSVHLESELGVGSSFFLSLPLSAAEAPIKHDDKRASPAYKTVLVIDDDSTFRYVFRQTLADTGYKIEEAVDGVEGLEKLNRIQPDVIFLDLYMPRLDGYSVLQEITRANNEPKPRVIVVTSSVLGPVERARLSSADAILSKANLSRKEIMPLLSTVESAA